MQGSIVVMMSLSPFDRLILREPPHAAALDKQDDREGDKTVMVSVSLATGASGASSRTILRSRGIRGTQDDSVFTVWAAAPIDLTVSISTLLIRIRYTSLRLLIH